MEKFTQKTIDVIQWLFIVVLVFMLIVQCLGYNKLKNDLVTSEEYRKENTYVRIYESQKMDKLKRENKELYDSICKLQDVESGMIIKFVERYHTDTIKADKFTLEDSLSTYHYAHDNDTVKMNIDIKARDLEWITADITIHDKFTIINREKDGVNQTSIQHSGNADIENTAMWHRKENKKWYQKFVITPQIGFGYGLLNRKLDFYVGGGIGYNF